MLAVPTLRVGISVHEREHKIDLDLFCDWLEASILFTDDEVISKSDVVDVLKEQELYRNQDYAYTLVCDAWNELKRRQKNLSGGSPFAITGELVRTLDWREVSAHSFLLIVSCAKWYPEWASTFGHDYTEQGLLFEQITAESINLTFHDWSTHSTGWSASQTERLPQIVDRVSSLLGEKAKPVLPWTTQSANDAGLDILLYHSFPDARVATAVYLIQCASGSNWESKRKTPDLAIWKKLVEFTSPPAKGFALPFSLLDDEFSRSANIVEGMLLDRYRLLRPANQTHNWLSPVLHTRVLNWLAPRVSALVAYQPI